MNRIKYWLLRKLLGEICEKTDNCKTCGMRIEGELCTECAQAYAHEQARKVWGLDHENL